MSCSFMRCLERIRDSNGRCPSCRRTYTFSWHLCFLFFVNFCSVCIPGVDGKFFRANAVDPACREAIARQLEKSDACATYRARCTWMCFLFATFQHMCSFTAPSNTFVASCHSRVSNASPTSTASSACIASTWFNRLCGVGSMMWRHWMVLSLSASVTSVPSQEVNKLEVKGKGVRLILSRLFSICDVLQPAVRMVNISAMCFCVTCLFMIWCLQDAYENNCNVVCYICMLSPWGFLLRVCERSAL